MAESWIPSDKQGDIPELFVSCVWRPPLEDSFLHTIVKVGRIPKKFLQVFVVPYLKHVIFHKYSSIYAEYKYNFDENSAISQEQFIQLEENYEKLALSIVNDNSHKENVAFPDTKIDGIFSIEFLLHSELTIKQKNIYALSIAKKECDKGYTDIIEQEIRKCIKFNKEYFKAYFREFTQGKINKSVSINNDIQCLEQENKSEKQRKATDEQKDIRKKRVAVTDELKLKAGKIVQQNPNLKLDEIACLLSVSIETLRKGKPLRIVIDSVRNKEYKTGRKIHNEEGYDDFYLDD